MDLEITGPSNNVLYKEMKKQYDTFTWTADIDGEHRFCFSNEFSTFTHKLVYFDFQVWLLSLAMTDKTAIPINWFISTV